MNDGIMTVEGSYSFDGYCKAQFPFSSVSMTKKLSSVHAVAIASDGSDTTAF